jgi:hypothetical protein
MVMKYIEYKKKLIEQNINCLEKEITNEKETLQKINSLLLNDKLELIYEKFLLKLKEIKKTDESIDKIYINKEKQLQYYLKSIKCIISSK